MKAFRFNLQVVHTLRQRQEQKAMEQYAAVLTEQRRALSTLQSTQLELEGAWAEWNAAITEGAPAALLSQTRDYFQAVEARRLACLEVVRSCERKVQHALQAMLVSRQEREAVDAFFDHQKEQYDRALEREERKVLDEMAQRRSPASIFLWSPQHIVTHE
jgi:flagellar export protein FliJ